MSASNDAVPEPFSSQDYDRRVDGVVSSAAEQGLAGVIVMPGPDLRWLIGYHPPASTERLTMLVLLADEPPTLLVPVFERPDAEEAGRGQPVNS